MKKVILKLSPLLLLLTVFLAGCKNDDDDVKSDVEFPTKFSALTVEQNKENLETNGIELVNNANTLKESTGVQSLLSLSVFLDNDVPDNLESGRISNGGALGLISALAKGKSTLKETLSGMRSIEDDEDDFESFQAEYNAAIGVYTYNADTETWSEEQTGDKIVFNFPSTEEGTTNDAQFSIYGLTAVTITSGVGPDDYTGDYPTGLKSDLTINGVKKLGYEFSASYNSAGEPSALSTSITVDDFVLAYDIVNTTTNVSVDNSFKKGDKILFALGASATGTFNTTSVEDENNDAGDIFDSGTAYFQILNVKFSGLLNAKELFPALENNDLTQEQKLESLNKNYKLIVFYADSKEKIADSEFYVAERFNGFENEEYLEIRMIFADGSKSDIEAYTDASFTDLEDQIDILIENEDDEE